MNARTQRRGIARGTLPLPEQPWHMPPREEAEEGLAPGDVEAVAERNGVGVSAPAELAGWLNAAGISEESYRRGQPGRVMRWTRSKGVVLGLWPWLSEESREAWGVKHAMKGRSGGGAPMVVAVTGKVEAIGPWTLEEALQSGYVLVGPRGEHWAAKAAGWLFHKEAGVWWTQSLRRAAALAAYGDEQVQRRLLRKGFPASLVPWMRSGPTLVPWGGKKWIVLASHSPKSGFRSPGRGWRECREGWEARDAQVAEGMAGLAPRPLARYLAQARREHALERVTAGSVELVLGGGSGGWGGPAPKPQKEQLVWCGGCCEAASTVPLGEGVEAHKCGRAACAEGGVRYTGIPLAMLAHLRERSGTTREAWRKIGWRMAEAAMAANRVEWEGDVQAQVPKGRTLRPTQEEAVRHALTHRIAVNGTEMGGGKTIVALMAMNHLLAGEEARRRARVLVVCPAALVRNWMREADRWLRPDVRVVAGLQGSAVLPGAGVAIASYQRIRRWPALAQWAAEGPLDLMVCDEGHRAKNWDAKTTKAVYAIAAKRRQILSGTLVPNRPSDVQPILAALAPEAFGGAGRFQWAYQVKDVKAPTEEEETMCLELGERLREAVLYRPLVSETLGDLPEPMPAKVMEVEITGGRRIGERERELLALRGKAGAETMGVLAQLQKLRGEVGDGKVERLDAIMAKALEGSGPALFFATHRRVAQASVDWMARRGMRCALIDGSMGQHERLMRQDDFQHGRLQALGLTYDAGGEGLNLQRAAHIVLMELDWRPKMIEQAIGRAQRPGRRGRLETTYVIAKETLDGYMARTIVGKSRTIGQALGDSEERMWWEAGKEPFEEGAEAA